MASRSKIRIKKHKYILCKSIRISKSMRNCTNSAHCYARIASPMSGRQVWRAQTQQAKSLGRHVVTIPSLRSNRPSGQLDPLVKGTLWSKNLWSMEPLVKGTLWSKGPSGQRNLWSKVPSGQKISGQWDSGQNSSGQRDSGQRIHTVQQDSLTLSSATLCEDEDVTAINSCNT